MIKLAAFVLLVEGVFSIQAGTVISSYQDRCVQCINAGNDFTT